MEPVQIIFYLFAGITVLSALVLLFAKNVLYAAFSLMLTFLGVAAVYVFAAADFIAVTQIMVYVGGILVLMIFGVMLTNRLTGDIIEAGSHQRIPGYLLGGTLLVLLVNAILKVNFASLDWIQRAQADQGAIQSTVPALGIRMMSDYVVPFEVVAILLLLALIGAVYLSRSRKQSL